MDVITKIAAKATFINGPMIDVYDEHSTWFIVEFYEKMGNDWGIVHSWHEHKPFCFYKYARKFRTKWKIKVWGWENEKPELVYEHLYNEEGKNVGLKFKHNSYNVQKAWAEKAIQFRKKNQCNLFVESKFSERLASEFYVPGVEFVSSMDQLGVDFYACYIIEKSDIQTNTESWWESDLIWENHAKAYKSWKIPIDWVSIPNEEVIDVILGDE